MPENPQQTYLLAQLERKRALKQECLYQSAPAQLSDGDAAFVQALYRSRRAIGQAAKKLAALGQLGFPMGKALRKSLSQQTETLRELLEREKLLYAHIPAPLKQSALARDSEEAQLLLGGALKRLEQVVDAFFRLSEDELAHSMDEILYLLAGACGQDSGGGSETF